MRHTQGILQLKFQTNAKEDEILTWKNLLMLLSWHGVYCFTPYFLYFGFGRWFIYRWKGLEEYISKTCPSVRLSVCLFLYLLLHYRSKCKVWYIIGFAFASTLTLWKVFLFKFTGFRNIGKKHKKSVPAIGNLSVRLSLSIKMWNVIHHWLWIHQWIRIYIYINVVLNFLEKNYRFLKYL